MDWLNEPPEWREDGGVLSVVTGDEDRLLARDALRLHPRRRPFPQRARRRATSPPTVAFRGDYRELYDQAGLMLRLDAAELDQGRDRVRRRTADAERGGDARRLRLVDHAAARSTPTGSGCA